MSLNMFVRWNSARGAQPNETTPIRGPGGDITLEDSVLAGVASGSVILSFDPADFLAKAVVDAVMTNAESGIYDHLAEESADGQ